MQNDNDLNAGSATPGTGDSTAVGSPQANPSVSSGTPDNQNGTPATQGDEEKTRMRDEIRRLNQAVVDAKRGSRNNPQGNGQQGNPFDTPEGQYGIAIQVATSNLRNKLEDLIPLYPELPADSISRIRKNPWAFAKHDTFVNGDWESAALEIETAMVEEADKIAASKPVTPVQNPATVNANPAAEGSEDDTPAVPGSPEDQNDWTMPLDKLEAKAAKAKRAVAQVSQSNK